MVLKHRFSGVFGRVSFERGRNYRVLKPERFICIVLQIQRNCRALKPRLRGLCRQNGLEEDKITWYSIHSFWRRKSYMVLKPDFFDVPMNFQLGRVIAGFSNKHSAWLRWPYGLEGNRIAGFSNLLRRRKRRPRDWKGNRIAGCSNDAAI